jgi:Tfp pilus assembly protein PilO
MEVAMKIENRQKLLMIMAAAAVGLLIADNLLIEPAIKWWSARSKEITELRADVKRGKSQIAREQVIRGEWDHMRSNTLPSKSAAAEQQVISAFDQWSRNSGVEITGIMPQWKNDTDDYQTLNCRVEVSGTLSTLSQFLYYVEKGPMALKLDSMELGARDSGGQQLTLGLQVSGLALINPVQTTSPTQ